MNNNLILLFSLLITAVASFALGFGTALAMKKEGLLK